jgi:glycosyltransferase involved in cell wall biosynthesis
VRVVFQLSRLVYQTGSYRRSHALARGLRQRGHEVTLVVPRAQVGLQPHCQEDHGVPVLAMSGVLPARLRTAGVDPADLMARLLWHLPAEVVVLGSHRPVATVPSFWKARVPVVYDWTDLMGKDGLGRQRRGTVGRLLAWLDERMERRVVQQASAVTAITSALAERAVALGIPRERVLVLPAGVDRELLAPSPREVARTRLRLPRDRPLVLYAGYTTWDLPLVVAVVEQLAQRLPHVLIALLSPLPEELCRRLPRGRGLARVLLREPVSYEEYRWWLAAADVGLAPYPPTPFNYFRFPNRFGDFLAAERPLVTNPTGEAGRLLRAYGAAVLVEDDPLALAMGVEQVLQDPTLAAAVVAGGRALAQERLDWRLLAAELEQFLSRLVA